MAEIGMELSTMLQPNAHGSPVTDERGRPDGRPDPLHVLVETSRSVIGQLERVLHAGAAANGPSTSAPSSSPDSRSPAQAQLIDVLSLAHDSASLIKAQATKLSLLMINEPFSPSAIAQILGDLAAGPIPALASAVQLCGGHVSLLKQELSWRCCRVLRELKALVAAVPLDGKVLAGQQKNGGKGEMGSMTMTGVVWAACDDVVVLKKLGPAGLLVQKVEAYRDMLQDVLDELKEWQQEEDGPEEETVEYVTNQLETTHLSAQEMLDDLMTPPRIPGGDPDKIRQRLDCCLKRLRLTTLLYRAVVKRRLKTLPTSPGPSQTTMTQRLDEVLPLLKRIPDRFNDIACAFYDMETDAIDEAMDACFFDAVAASEMLMKTWDGGTDDFTTWAEKFQIVMREAA